MFANKVSPQKVLANSGEARRRDRAVFDEGIAARLLPRRKTPEIGSRSPHELSRLSEDLPNKLVAVMNEKTEPGVIMNALAHLCIGFGSDIGKELLSLSNYVDADGGSHPHISEMPFMILKANSNKLRALRLAALQAGIRCVDFTDTMTIGTYIEQIGRTKLTKEADLIYYGVVLFGDWGKVTELTRKFSLWK